VFDSYYRNLFQRTRERMRSGGQTGDQKSDVTRLKSRVVTVGRYDIDL